MHSILPQGCEPECRACPHRTLSLRDSQEQKLGFVAQTLEPWMGVLQPIRGLTESGRWGYRERAVLHAEYESGSWRLGLQMTRGQGREREKWVLPIPNCPVHSVWLRDVQQRLDLSLLPQAAALHAVVIEPQCVGLILKAPPTDRFDAELAHIAEGAGVANFWIQFNPSVGNRVASPKRWRQVRGNSQLTPGTFAQQLPELHADSVREAEAFLFEYGPSALIDWYSGCGTTLGVWRARGVRTIGVEISGSAVRVARQQGFDVLQGRVEERLPQLERWLGEEASGLYANPSRLGLEPASVRWALKQRRIARMAYLSCSPGTLARDLELLAAGTGAGYSVKRLIPYDFIPNTRHVEVLALLERPAL